MTQKEINLNSKDLVRQFLAGAFFIVGMVLTILFILTIGKDKGFAQARFHVPVIFHDVGGLSEGAPVLLAGVNVGNVASLEFLDEPIDGRGVQVTLSILSRYKKQLNQNVRFSIKTEGVLGEKLIEIYVLEGGEKVDLTKPIIGEDPFDVQDLAAIFSIAAESFTKTSNELREIDMVELAEVMTDSSRALLETSQGLNAIMEQLQDITLKSKRIIDRFEQKLIKGELFSVF